MTQLRERFRLKLADAFACEAESFTDTFERHRFLAGQTEPQRKDHALPFGQRGERALEFLAPDRAHYVGEELFPVVRDEVSDRRLTAVADRCLQRQRGQPGAQQLQHALGRHTGCSR